MFEHITLHGNLLDQGSKTMTCINRIFQTASTNLLRAKVKVVLQNKISLLISTLSNTTYHLDEPEQIQHCPLSYHL